ncbi:uncharacterized protein EV422DRAFT_149488 [Fimicolochytrium jonesii]|uniref:uncharacterized protein n=1 Tax=Fimicolochytrium jonesii TaxID=1396493 RepID=UPI0022FEFD2C|nr:uncharacterized protein EV422DRAFT_149488 [Fimicolochytrium jonesii]KAI8826003.1 hypothetical protein EV422DRAFT_149488 [Fimicolochytrium jonesii]
MSRHSKNNTALAFFTHYEKSKLNYGTTKQRLGRDSMRNFDACFLCLQRAREPLCCPEGHLSCKECMYENILAQKKDIARQQKLYEEQQALLEAERQSSKDAAKEAEIALFEQTEAQFLPTSMKAFVEIGDDKRLMSGKVYKMVHTADGVVYQYDKDENRTRAEETAKLTNPETKTIGVDPKGKSLPSFWIPSLTPDAKIEIVHAPKLETMCTATETPHPYQTTHRDQVHQRERRSDTAGCCAKFVRPSLKCHICEKKCKIKDIVELDGEGTGFVSGGGKVESSKTSVAFQ